MEEHDPTGDLEFFYSMRFVEWREGKKMLPKHWLMILVVLAVGYFLGTKYPNLLSKVTG